MRCADRRQVQSSPPNDLNWAAQCLELILQDCNLSIRSTTAAKHTSGPETPPYPAVARRLRLFIHLVVAELPGSYTRPSTPRCGIRMRTRPTACAALCPHMSDIACPYLVMHTDDVPTAWPYAHFWVVKIPLVVDDGGMALSGSAQPTPLSTRRKCMAGAGSQPGTRSRHVHGKCNEHERTFDHSNRHPACSGHTHLVSITPYPGARLHMK